MTQAMQHNRGKAESGLASDIEELLAGFADADQTTKAASIETLYHHYKPVAVRYARRCHTGDVEGVADLALFDTFRALADLRTANDLTVHSYLFRAIQSYSIKENRKPIPTPTEVFETDVEPVQAFESDLIGSLYVGDLIDELPEDQRAVMTHRIIHGRTADETAFILGKKANAVYQLQNRATRRLQRMLLAAAVLLMVIGAAVVVVRQADSQRIDSSPANPTTIERTERSTTTTTQPSSNPQTELTIGDRAQSNADQQIQAGAIEQQRANTPAVNAPTTVAITAAAPSDTAGSNTADSDTASQDPNTTTPDTTTSETTTPDTTTPETTTPTTTASTVPETTTLRAVVAVDDALEFTVGQSVNFNIMANDGPGIALGTVTWISGVVEGLTLGEDGRLTGVPTEAGTDTIVYQLNGNNSTFDTGFVRVVVK